MKILITGANGQIGTEIQRRAKPAGVDVLPYDHEQLSITDTHNILAVLRDTKPDFVVNCAAYTQVDNAENLEIKTFEINRDGALKLARLCEQLNIPLIHLSTDYVFDGNNPGAYKEDDEPNPINVYGHSKLYADEGIQDICPKHIILRTSGVFSAHGHNFVKTILRLAAERDELKIVNDQITCPTPAQDIADVILKLVKQGGGYWGVYHYSAIPATSWYDFALAIMELAQQRQNFLVKKIVPVTTSQYPTPALRPLNSVLDCHKICTRFGIQQRNWHLGLEEVINELLP